MKTQYWLNHRLELEEEHTALLKKRSEWLQRNLIDYLSGTVRIRMLGYGFNQWQLYLRDIEQILMREHAVELQEMEQASLDKINESGRTPLKTSHLTPRLITGSQGVVHDTLTIVLPSWLTIAGG